MKSSKTAVSQIPNRFLLLLLLLFWKRLSGGVTRYAAYGSDYVITASVCMGNRRIYIKHRCASEEQTTQSDMNEAEWNGMQESTPIIV